MFQNDGMFLNNRFRKISSRGLVTGALSALALSLTVSPALAECTVVDPNGIVIPCPLGFNESQASNYNLITTVCPSGKNEPTFQQRCNNVVGAALSGHNPQVVNALQPVTPSQISFQGDQATKLSGGQLATLNTAIIARLTSLRLGLTDGTNTMDLRFARTIQSSDNFVSTVPNLLTGGAASADSPNAFSPLSGFLNAIYNFGNVNSTFQQQAGFNYNIGGFIAGADYRYTDNLIFGAAFSYQRSNTNFNNSLGDTNSNSYIGSLYGTFYATDRFYIDGVATYGWINYNLNRKILYTISPNKIDSQGDSVNTTAKSSPNGNQYSFSLGSGYDYAWNALTVNPYVRLNYTKLYVNSYSESGGDGWATRISSQGVNSFTTALGTRLSYAVSIPWGVAMPQLWGEWVHEFENNAQSIEVGYLGNYTNNQNFSVFTARPDRDYFTLGAGISGVFAHGVSAFFSYEALLGYNNTNSNQFVLGGRIEF
jgi:uncharacterized protein with beta-barrel porin domain